MAILLISVAISFLNACLPVLTQKISNLFVPKDKRDSNKNETEEILAEIKSTSMRNDFPKFARLTRRLKKLKEEDQNAGLAYQAEYSFTSTKISYIGQVIMTLLSLMLFWMYRFHPVIKLPYQWLYPLDQVLSWPILNSGDISFPVWFLICNSVSKLIAGSVL